MLKESDMVISLPFGRDVALKLVRHVSNILSIASEDQQFSCQLTFQNNVQRDTFALLVRGLVKKYNDTPD